MLNRIVIKPHSASNSATALRDRIREILGRPLACTKLKVTGSAYRPKATDLFFNYGDSSLAPAFYGNATVLNRPDVLANTTNKLNALRALFQAGVPVVDFTTERNIALGWMNDREQYVYARTRLQGHSGAGIVVAKQDLAERNFGDFQYADNLPQAPLYTKGINGKRREYRVHVMQGVVTYGQLKRRRNGFEDNPEYSNEVRNHHTGWIYSTNNVAIPREVIDAATRAVAALGLSFGAVDVISKDGNAYVLEVNTAPGMTGTTLEVYAQNLVRIMRGENVLDVAGLGIAQNAAEAAENAAEVAREADAPVNIRVEQNGLDVEFVDVQPAVEPVAMPEPAPEPIRPARRRQAAQAAAPAEVFEDRAIYRDAAGGYWQYNAIVSRFATFGMDVWVPRADIAGELNRVV